jgi:hypothetical protein
MSTAETGTAAGNANPEALSQEYHKAHKQAMLWGVVLFIWELVGVDLEKAKEGGGNLGTIISSLKSPQAVPWVLLALAAYFLFKCSIEWGQCHVDRRKVLLARFDFMSAWLLSVAAIALYLGQRISRVRFADLLQRNRSLAIGLIVGAVSYTIGSRLWEVLFAWKDGTGKPLGGRKLLLGFGFFFLGALLLLVILVSIVAGQPIRVMAMAIAVGYVFAWLTQKAGKLAERVIKLRLARRVFTSS